MRYTIVEDGTVINIIVVNQGDSSDFTDTAQMIKELIKQLSKQHYQGGGSSSYCFSQSTGYHGCSCNSCIHRGYIHTGGYGGGNSR